MFLSGAHHEQVQNVKNAAYRKSSSMWRCTLDSGEMEIYPGSWGMSSQRPFLFWSHLDDASAISAPACACQASSEPDINTSVVKTKQLIYSVEPDSYGLPLCPALHK